VTCQVAGVSFNQTTINSLTDSSVLVAVADPANPHDPDAVKVLTSDGRSCGHIPNRNGLASRLKATSPGPWKVTVEAIGEPDTTLMCRWLRVTVHIRDRGEVSAELLTPVTACDAAASAADPNIGSFASAPGGTRIGVITDATADTYLIRTSVGATAAYPKQYVTVTPAA